LTGGFGQLVDRWTFPDFDYTARMTENQAAELNGTVVTVDFIRHRNVMLVRADLSPLFVDYYLHLAEHGIKHSPENDQLLKNALAVFALHCASRPQAEHLAWTIGLQEPRLNLFFSGDNEDYALTGRMFTENVKDADKNVFYSDIVPRRGRETRRSVINFEGADLFAAAMAYYEQSEQRPMRFFDMGEDHYAMLISQPDCDEAWLKQATPDELRKISETETLGRIETRLYRWECGCNQQKMLAALAPVARADIDDLFGESEMIRVECPRCAAAHNLSRETMEAYLAQTAK
jgi:molecular chaperone Hsp33